MNIYCGTFFLVSRPGSKQSLLNCVLAFIKRHTKYTYGHLDDLIIAHHDRRKLQVLLDVLRAKLRNAGWVINTKKSELNPVKNIKFLGANWDGLGIIRDKEATRFTREMAESLLTNDPKGRALQRVRGYLNYYLGYAGKVSPIVNTFIRMSLITRREYWWYLSLIINIDRLKFRRTPRKSSVWYTDASEYQLGAVDGGSGREFSVVAPTDSILFNEAAASLLPFLLDPTPQHRRIHIDNIVFSTFRAQYIFNLINNLCKSVFISRLINQILQSSAVSGYDRFG
ncbi:hypothetical protein BpHYR1_018808 [Brachionus plicatilis]|uniref:Reverse transcriptase domain-containing protein n=1 Tax=Brachionus plicatilis TaxID=10195 RepID=A0A3M7SV94_BRAPC|nr:hypothetical protein BpHYR1_018808 [Brachionus plicatilis]